MLSAIRTARALSAELSIPVVPLFWMASEDHDWQEVAALEGETATHRWRPLDAETPHPVGRRSLEGLQEVLSAWSSDLSKEGVVADVVEEFQKAQALGESLSGLMARRWLHRWYGHEGLLVFDADDASLKVFASHLWAAEFEGHGVHSVLQGKEGMIGPAHVRGNNVFWMDAEAGRAGVVKSEDNSFWQAGNLKVANRAGGLVNVGQSPRSAVQPGGAVETVVPRVVAAQPCRDCGAW